MKKVSGKSSVAVEVVGKEPRPVFGSAVQATELSASRQGMSRFFSTGAPAFDSALLRRIQILHKICEEARKRLIAAPDDQIFIKNSHGRTAFYKRSPDSAGDPEYLSKHETIELAELLNKEYDTRLLKVAERELAVLKRTASALGVEVSPKGTQNAKSLTNTQTVGGGKYESSIENIAVSFPEDCRRYILPVAIPDEDYAAAWQRQPFEALSFRSDDTTDFFTERGERVRSKSEQLIANALNRHGIPYKYECPVKLTGKTVYPDFTVLNKHTRDVFYWEHLGMLDDHDYAINAVKKINAYATDGYVPGKNLIITCESGSDPLGSTVVEIMINKHLIT